MSATLAAKVQRLGALVQVIQLKRAAQSGLLAFAAVFLAHLLSDPCCAYHHHLCAQLDWAVAPGHRLLGALPREHAKTTLGTLALVLRELCLGADAQSGGKRNILLIGANREEAAAKLRLIVHEIETNPGLSTAFGARLRPLRDAHRRNVAYRDNCIVLAGGTRVGALGFGGKVRGQLSAGRRLDLVVLDDPEDDASVATPERREKQARWVEQALLSALDVDHGSVVWLGSLLHHDSVLARKLKEHAVQAGWRTLCLSAIGEGGAPLWPGRWSLAKLEARRKEIGERAFAQEYQNQPVSLAEQVFKPECFKTYDPAGLTHRAGEWALDGVPLTVAIGVDPAIGEKAQHDWFAAVVLGLARADEAGWRGNAIAPDAPVVFVLDVLRIKHAFAAQLEQLAALCRQWTPRVVGIETVAYQSALQQAAWDLGLPATALGAATRKHQRIEAAALHQVQGRLVLPVAGAWVAAFREEAAHYPAGAHDDQLDALARALEAGLPLLGGGWEVVGAGKRVTDVKGFV